MKYFVTFLLISFVGLAVFGAFGMLTGMQNHDGNCIAADAKGIDCPKQNSLLGYITFHLNAYKDFSLSILNTNFISLLLISLVLVLLAGLAFSLFLRPSQFAFYRNRTANFSPSLKKRKLIKWLALHENSPNNF